MIIPELVAYISAERQKGVSDYILKQNFIAQGWSEADFAEAAAKLPPVHRASDAGSLVPALDKQPEWRAASGRPSASVAMPPSRKALKIGILLVLAGISCSAVFLYQDAVGSFVLTYYDMAQPLISQTVQGMAASIGLSQ